MDKLNEIISTLLTSLSTAFNKFVLTFKKNGLLHTTIILLLFILTFTLIINPIRIDTIVEEQIEKHYDKTKDEEQKQKSENDVKRIKADEIITPLLEDIQSKFQLDRVILFESHNNTENISHCPFLFYSATYEVIDCDDYAIDYISDSFQRQYTSNFLATEAMTMLKHKDYIYYDNLQNYNRNKSRLLIKLKRFGIKNTMLIPIRSKEGQVIMIIVVCNNDAINCDEVYKYLKPSLSQISQSLIIE